MAASEIVTVIRPGESDPRLDAFADVLRRMHLRGTSGETPIAAEAWQGRMKDLRGAGRMVRSPSEAGGVEMLYAPSAAVKTRLTGQHGPWPAKITKFLDQSVKAIPGAIFTLPIFEGTGAVEAFITDWTPFPAAAAVAVHPSHPLADEIGNAPDRATGLYVRHPLHGDLLPIWTASWVKPEFGTGSVIINPAHSRVDLDFARTVGLPIRFGLAPAVPTPDPQTWPVPPVINSGVAIRTGIADGDQASEVKRRYLDLLVSAGHAQVYTDRVLGTLTIAAAADATVSLDDPGWTPANPTVARILAGPIAGGAVVVAGTADIAQLLLLRALHIEVHGSDIPVSAVHMIAPASGDIAQRDKSAERDLAIVGFAKPEETASVKVPQFEQAQRFLEAHQKMELPAAPDDLAKARKTSAILTMIGAGQLSNAFSDLYKLQRDIKKQPDSVSQADRFGYYAAAFVLAGAEIPADYPLDEVIDGLTR